jgi:cytochrome P450
MRRGERVLALESSANHDDEEFERADEVILDRFPNRHVAFGIGTHRCVGMHVARLLFRTMMSAVLERMPDYRIIEAEAELYPDSGSVAGWINLPAVFTPGQRWGAEA